MAAFIARCERPLQGMALESRCHPETPLLRPSTSNTPALGSGRVKTVISRPGLALDQAAFSSLLLSGADALVAARRTPEDFSPGLNSRPTPTRRPVLPMTKSSSPLRFSGVTKVLTLATGVADVTALRRSPTFMAMRQRYAT